LYTNTYLFIAISKYIEVNRNSFNHCRPNEPEKSAAQEWQYVTLGEQEKMKAFAFIFISNQYNTVATLATHKMPRWQTSLQNIL
jgi:hypothetical protein